MPERMRWRRLESEWYTLYADKSIKYGGLFFNPKNMEFLEVIDLDSSSGVDEANLIVFGTTRVLLSVSDIKSGFEVTGRGEDQELLERVIESVKLISSTTSFHKLPRAVQKDILIAAEAVFAYRGFDEDRERHLILGRDRYSVVDAAEIARSWDVNQRNVFLIDDQDQKIWGILEGKYEVSRNQ